ncbi:LTA synthase family protein [Pedobacter nyackensis]|uniref:LTA synthase family protein n=1 Tax=Pedobacter nyackensis TaxID=475255 RepID=UPI00292D5E03|nr:sulfatase-like hydrolase/transferase [Pedobacter nyackensis]
MLKYLIFITLLLNGFLTKANTIEIRYHAPNATYVKMIWGINYWKLAENKPAGTTIQDKVMHSPMVKEGDDYVLKLDVPDSCTIEYLFQFAEKTALFKANVDFTDHNQLANERFYQRTIIGNTVIRISPDVDKLKPTKHISLLKYSVLCFLMISTLALFLFIAEKFFIKKAIAPLNPRALFFSIPIALLTILIIIRVMTIDELGRFLAAPLLSLPLLLKACLQDFIYTTILTVLFGVLFFIKKNNPRPILWTFAGFAIISIAIAIANIKITALLGRPFNYRWLYYSDFLMSSDASRAISDNIDKSYLFAYLVMILAAIPLVWLIYRLLSQRPVITVTFLILVFSTACITQTNLSVDEGKKENPVIYFISSLFQQNGLSGIYNKNVNIDQFARKNKNVLEPQYASAFKNSSIKNVIIFVLESAAAEYITPYNSIYQATPFLDSIKHSAVLFDAAYAHAPATNKSMVSLLCSSYPYLSYKSITAEKPGIKWPSISSELKKAGYRTSFFNSGDNRFQGADSFLKYRDIDEIKDFRQNACNVPIFSDPQYANENLEGITDACLPTVFFDWIKKDHSTPFFSMMWTYQTHYPYYSISKRINFNTNNELKERYLNALHDADKTLRELVEGLKKRDLLNSTLIVVLGDHGEAFGQHGQTSHAGGIFEENLRIPLIFINKQLFNGEHLTKVAGISDVAPTIFSILEKPIPNEWQGENLFSKNRREKVYFFTPYSDWLFGCREGDYKFIYNATTNTSYLYNLKTDPHEAVNIASEQPKYTEKLSSDLNSWIQYQIQHVNSYLK